MRIAHVIGMLYVRIANGISKLLAAAADAL